MSKIRVFRMSPVVGARYRRRSGTLTRFSARMWIANAQYADGSRSFDLQILSLKMSQVGDLSKVDSDELKAIVEGNTSQTTPELKQAQHLYPNIGPFEANPQSKEAGSMGTARTERAAKAVSFRRLSFFALTLKNPGFYASGMNKLQLRWQRCVYCLGAYFGLLHCLKFEK